MSINNTLTSQVESIIKNVKLTRQDVLELTECILQEYIDQQLIEHGEREDDDEQKVDVKQDDDGDFIDKDGYIYDIKTHIRIGQKDLQTKEKVMYSIV